VLKTVPMPESAFDMVYIDGEKREYPDYYDKLFCYVKPGGFIVADNTLWGGHVSDPGYNDDRTAAIRRFNDMVAADDRTEVAMVPVRDGFSIIKKIKD
jgi:predicted O-methyltransferase YrrM